MKKLLSLMAVLTISLGIAACGGNDSNMPPQGTEYQESNLNNYQDLASENSAGFVTVTHRSGVTEVPLNPQRVAIFDMGMLDTLDLLGVDIIGLPQGNIPSYLSQYASSDYENLGTLHEPNLEMLVEQDVDLIIITGRARPHYEELSQIAPTIDLGGDNDNIMEVFRSNNLYLGKIFGMESDVQEILDGIEEQINEIRAQAEALDKTALIILHNEGRISAFGPGSRFGIIHDVLNIPPVDPNIEVVNHGNAISNEFIVENNPDMLFVIDRSAVITGGQDANREDIENELIQLTDAYANGNIFYLTSEIWYISVGGLQSMQMQLNEISEALASAANN